jgi:shikimate dehydrogenase
MNRKYRFGLLGHDVAYSKSPSIFSALAEFRGAEIQFETIDIAPENLDSTIVRLKQLDGFSVTIPFKEAILPHMDDVSENARQIGAVNSVRIDKGRMHGYNTDGIGFIAPLRKVDFGGRKILVLGIGGAARAVVWALIQEYPSVQISVCARDPGRITYFVADIMQRYRMTEEVHGMTFDALEPSEGFDLIVNCTPVGGAANSEECPLPESFEFNNQPTCYDLVYDPAMTVFLTTARRTGCRVIGGLPMLIRQAVESYGIWTGDDFDRDAMSAEVLDKLHEDEEGDES